MSGDNTAVKKENLIQIDHLVKTFGDNTVLRMFPPTLKTGRRSIIGPSGSGKSTLLRCMNLLESPTSGHIYFDGEELREDNADINVIRQKMGMVFQHFNLFPNMTVRRNITLAPVRTGKMKQAEADEECMKLFHRVGLRTRRTPIRHPSPADRSRESRLSVPWPCTRS